MTDRFSVLHRQASEMLIQSVHDHYDAEAALEGLDQAVRFGRRARNAATNMR